MQEEDRPGGARATVELVPGGSYKVDKYLLHTALHRYLLIFLIILRGPLRTTDGEHLVSGRPSLPSPITLVLSSSLRGRLRRPFLELCVLRFEAGVSSPPGMRIPSVVTLTVKTCPAPGSKRKVANIFRWGQLYQGDRFLGGLICSWLGCWSQADGHSLLWKRMVWSFSNRSKLKDKKEILCYIYQEITSHRRFTHGNIRV